MDMATQWAMKQQTGCHKQKLVLTCLAHLSEFTDTAQALAHVAKLCDMSEESVLSQLEALDAAGLVHDLERPVSQVGSDQTMVQVELGNPESAYTDSVMSLRRWPLTLLLPRSTLKVMDF